MKKIAALALLAAVSAGASAQSSVSLFGVLDANVTYVKNGSEHQTNVDSSGLNTSRIGLKGIEDLGSGLKAGFWLESAVGVDTGTAGSGSRFWNRRSTVSLIGNFGEVRLGRDFTPTYLGYEEYDPWFDTGITGSSKFDSSLGTDRDTGTRADNMVTYLTPNTLGGFYARASVAAGEGTTGKKYYGGRFGYATGPVDVSVSYGRTEVAEVAGDDKFKTWTAGGSYDFNVVKLSGYFQQNEFVDAKVQNYLLGASIPVGVGEIRASWIHSNAKGNDPTTGLSIDDADANQYSLGYIYNMSKRTALYGTYSYIKNKGDAIYTVANVTNYTPTGGDKSQGVQIGIRHSF